VNRKENFGRERVKSGGEFREKRRKPCLSLERRGHK
jgi:hypothetical protein